MEQSLTLSKSTDTFQNIILVLCGSLLLSLAAYIQIPLFFTPLPLVLQNSIAVALGALLGSKKGALAVFSFLIYGCCSLPVFAGGSFGLSTLFSPISAGYLFGYCIAAFFTGKIVENKVASLPIALLAGHLSILLLGTGSLALAIGLKQAFYLGFLPFIATDIVKSIVLAKLLTIRRS